MYIKQFKQCFFYFIELINQRHVNKNGGRALDMTTASQVHWGYVYTPSVHKNIRDFRLFSTSSVSYYKLFEFFSYLNYFKFDQIYEKKI